MKKIIYLTAAASFAILVGLNVGYLQVKAQENQNKNPQKPLIEVTFIEPNYDGEAPQGKTRGFASRTCDISKLSMAPIIPKDSRGLTIQQSPRVWVNITYDQNSDSKQNSEIMGDFSLEDINSTVKVVKDSKVKIPLNSTNLSIKIPYSLEEGKWYRWYLVIPLDNLDCTVEGTNSTNMISLEGTIQRVSHTDDPTNLSKQKSEDLVRVYSQKGFWYDALEEAAKLKCQIPSLLEPWNHLLKEAHFNEKQLRNISQARTCYK